MPLEIIVPVAAFTLLVLALCGLVLIARRILEPSGSIAVSLDDGRIFEIPAGQRLLGALARHGIYLPAACGGRGTCGECRVTVTAGAPPLLPTEEPHIGTADAAAGVRLACMLTIRRPLAIRLDADMLTARQTAAVVVSSHHVTAWLKEIVLRPETPLAFEAGDYLLIEAMPQRISFRNFDIDPGVRDRWEQSGLFRLESEITEATTRAYSIANAPNETDSLTLVVRIALPPPSAPPGTPPGRVSSYLYSLKPGDRVTVRGPYGDFHIQESEREMVFIGGGAGIAPLRSMIRDQLARRTRRKMSFWYGARDVDDICYAEEFGAAAAQHPNFSFCIALSSPGPGSRWQGPIGFVHSVVHDRYLRDHPDPASVEFYLCGPPLMSAASLDMLGRLGVPRNNIFFDDFGA